MRPGNIREVGYKLSPMRQHVIRPLAKSKMYIDHISLSKSRRKKYVISKTYETRCQSYIQENVYTRQLTKHKA